MVVENPSGQAACHALNMLLEGALADAELAIDDTQLLVPLIKDLARGNVWVEDLV